MSWGDEERYREGGGGNRFAMRTSFNIERIALKLVPLARARVAAA